jgi:L,D-transpeptidase ErfK/SrfK
MRHRACGHRRWLVVLTRRLCVFVAIVLSAGIARATAVLADEGIPGITGGAWTYHVVPGDTWRTIGSRVGVDPQVLSAGNGLKVNTALRRGQALQIDNRHIVPTAAIGQSLVVNIPQRMLFMREESGDVTGFPVAVGRRDWPTPIQPFRIVTRERDPSWDVPDSIREEARRAGKWLPAVVPPGPNNPLGQFWLGLSTGSIGIHGTNAPASIYRAATHGCIRLHPDDVAWLFDHVDVGTPGQVIYEAVLLAWVGDHAWVEAHPDVYRNAVVDARQALRVRAASLGVTEQIDWAAADKVLELREGIARRVTTTTR